MPSDYKKSYVLWIVFYLTLIGALVVAGVAPPTFRPIPLCDVAPFVLHALDQACSLYGTSTTAKAAAHWGTITVAQERVISVFAVYAVIAIVAGFPWRRNLTTHLWFDDLANRQFVLRWNDIDTHPRYTSPRPWIITVWTVAGLLFGFFSILTALHWLIWGAVGAAIGVLASLNVGRPRLHRRGIAITYDGFVKPVGPPIKGAAQKAIALDAITGVEIGTKKDWVGARKRWIKNPWHDAYEGNQVVIYAMGSWGTPVFFSESVWDRSAHLPIQTAILRMIEVMKPRVAQYCAQAERIGSNSKAKEKLDAWMTAQIQSWIDQEIHRKKPAAKPVAPIAPQRSSTVAAPAPQRAQPQPVPAHRPPLTLREDEPQADARPPRRRRGRRPPVRVTPIRPVIRTPAQDAPPRKQPGAQSVPTKPGRHDNE